MSGEVFTVETIRAITEVSGVPFYLVKWLGYDDPAEDTWEPAESFASKKSLKKLILESDPKFVELNDIKARGYRPFDKYNLVEVKKETIKVDSKVCVIILDTSFGDILTFFLNLFFVKFRARL
ncbi:hypothetical protein BKA69DRAFT_450322 [Paraphysoderma sedebokerense]|nr:hypothetical protein BKA69DRAFT_450322 [Paraphysoderma sedebokerense]